MLFFFEAGSAFLLFWRFFVARSGKSRGFSLVVIPHHIALLPMIPTRLRLLHVRNVPCFFGLEIAFICPSLMESKPWCKKFGDHQLIWYISHYFTGFHTCQVVVGDLFHQQFDNMLKDQCAIARTSVPQRNHCNSISHPLTFTPVALLQTLLNGSHKSFIILASFGTQPTSVFLSSRNNARMTFSKNPGEQIGVIL